MIFDVTRGDSGYVASVTADSFLIDAGVLAFYDEQKRLKIAFARGQWKTLVPAWEGGDD